MSTEKTSLVRVSTKTLTEFRKACLDLGLTAKDATEWLMQGFVREWKAKEDGEKGD